jgi:hypothetical protein
MIVLDFEQDPRALREIDFDPIEVDEGDLELVLARQAVDFTVEETKILDHVYIPLFYAACGMLDGVKTLTRTPHREIEIPGGSLLLIFDVIDNGRFRVREDSLHKEARGGFRELISVWERFSERAKTYLLEELPSLAENPLVGGWFLNDPAWSRPGGEWE